MSNGEEKAAVQLSKYDVVLQKSGSASNTTTTTSNDYELAEGLQHIGNNRFVVFCNMNLPQFRTSIEPVERDTVVRTIIDRIGNQCIDESCQREGKFVDQESNAELDMHDVMQFVRKTLQRQEQESVVEEDLKKRRRRSSLLRRSMSSGDMFEDHKKRVDRRESILRSLELLGTCTSEDEEDGQDEDAAIEAQHSCNDTGNDKETKPKAVAAANTARRASMLVTRPTSRPTLERASSWNSSTSHEPHVLVANVLDVIFVKRNESSYSLLPNHTGNNRVQVMVQLRLNKYQKDPSNIETLCFELVETVQIHYKARFLLEEDSDRYICLTNVDAMHALKHLFEATNMGFQKEQTLLELQKQLPTSNFDDIHKAAIASLKNRRKQSEVKSRISSLSRGQSTQSESSSIQLLQQQPVSGYASVGDVPRPERPLRYASTGHVPEPRPRHTGNVPEMRRYSTVLSEFSQDMVKEMLRRLDVENEELQQQSGGLFEI